MAVSMSEIPTVDLSPFFTLENGDKEDEKKKAMEVISQACSEYGFFQVVNHGVPLELLSRALDLSKTFFCISTRGVQSSDRSASSRRLQQGPGKLAGEERVRAGVSTNVQLQCLPQYDAGGLEVFKNGKWIPVVPSKDALVVNVGDAIRVMSNNKFKSATHRVVRPKGRSRCSYAFFRNSQGDKWVEALTQFTVEIGESPKYRGFLLKEYQDLRMRNKTHPPSKPEDVIHITHYAINN